MQNRFQLSAQTLKGLCFLNKYRFLTIAQFARLTGYSQYHAGELLRGLEKQKIVSYFGFQSIPGQGRQPKVYYPTHLGHRALMWHSNPDPDQVGSFVPVSDEITWTPEMYHRLKLIDVFLSLELSVLNHDHLEVTKVLLSYRRLPKTYLRETTDILDTGLDTSRFVPDGAFVLHNHETDRRALFFIESDMGTERLTAPKSRDQRSTIKGKLELYDRYLTSGKFAATYQDYGQFRSFLLLFVTTSVDRIENIRKVATTLAPQFHAYYRFTTFDDATANFLGQVWLTRDSSDTLRHALIQRA